MILILLFSGCPNPPGDDPGDDEDITPPSIGTAITSSGTSGTATSVNWGAAADDVTSAANLEYKLVKAASAEAIDSVSEANAVSGADLAMDWTANTLTKAVTGLTPSTTYYFAVLVRDAAGNMSLYSPQSVTTSASGDTTPPSLSGVSSSGVTGTTITLTATSNEAGTMYYVVTTSSSAPTAAQVIAGQNNSGGAAAKSGSSTVSASTAKSFSASGLNNFTKYYYYIAAVDIAGNQSSVSGGDFATIGDDCVARYTFENAITDSVGSNNLTGSPSYSTADKKEGASSLYLNGSTSLTAAFTLSDTESISAWVYLDATAGLYSTPIALGGSAGLQFYYDSGNLIGCMGNGGTTATGSFTTGAWHHIAVTAIKSSDTLYLYIDGVQYSGSGDGDSSGETNNIYIGDDGSGGYYWKGYIDDVQIYNRVLSASEVSALYATY